MESINLANASNYSGYVEKKSPSLFVGYQKRHLRVLEGKLLAYFGSEEDKTAKGVLEIIKITGLAKSDKKM